MMFCKLCLTWERSPGDCTPGCGVKPCVCGHQQQLPQGKDVSCQQTLHDAVLGTAHRPELPRSREQVMLYQAAETFSTPSLLSYPSNIASFC